MKNNKKGFTLAEMLIVVAIIAILIAILIPTFTKQLEKAKEAADAANIRSAQSEVAAKYLVDGGAYYKEVQLTQNDVDSWLSLNDTTGTPKIGGVQIEKAGSNKLLYVLCGADGTISVKAKTDNVTSGYTLATN